VATLLAPPLPSFWFRLRLAALSLFVLWFSALGVTCASLFTYAKTTLTLDPTFQPMGDFDAYYRAAVDLARGADPYLRYNHNLPFSLSLGYIYPPFLARVLQPLTVLSLSQIHVLALLVLQISVLASVLLTWKLLALRSWPARLLILDVFLLSSGLTSSLQVGNVNVLLIPLTLCWVYAYTRNHSWSWVFVGLNVGLKLTQAPLFALTLLRRDFRGLTWGLLTLLATLIIGGFSLAVEFFTQTLPRLTSTVPTGAQNTSLLADFERFLHPGSDNLAYDPSFAEAHFLLFPLIALILFCTFRALHHLRDRLLTALLCLTAVPLFSNYLGASHLLALLPVGLLLAAYAWRLKAYRSFALIVVCLFFVADYALFYTLVTALNYFVARALFYELAPGLAALALWLVSLHLAQRVKSLALARS
jgi:hypothetical protein